jgi:hypothetical protein
MKSTELIALLQEEVKHFGDRDFMMFCPRHSGEDGPPVAVNGLGWYGDIEKHISASFLDCVECHEEDMRDKAEADAMDELEHTAGLEPDEPMDLEEFDSL